MLLQSIMNMILLVGIFHTTTGHNLFSYTENEMENIYKVRLLLGDLLHKDYMEKDAFIYNFLIARHHNVNKAAAMIQQHLKWRFDNGIDFITDEVNEAENYMSYKTGRDRENASVLLVHIDSRSNLRKSLISGLEKQSTRLAWKIFENLYIKSREFNQTQVVVIVDMYGFNYKEHACKQCVPFGERVARSIEDNYPGIAKAFFFINTSRLFEVFLSIIRATFSVATNNILNVYGFDKEEWINALLKYISKDELQRLFGHKIIVSTKNPIQSHEVNEVNPKAKNYPFKSNLTATISNNSGTEASQALVLHKLLIHIIFYYLIK